MLAFSLEEIPFSFAGSFLIITSQNSSGSHRLLYRTRSGRAVNRREWPFAACDFFEIALLRGGNEVPYEWTAQPHRLDLLASGDGQATFVFADPDTLLFSTRGVDLRLVPVKPFAVAFSPDEHQLHLVDVPARGIHKLRAFDGTQISWSAVQPNGTSTRQPENSSFQVTFSEYSGRPGSQGALRFSRTEGIWSDTLPDLDEIMSRREREFDGWMERIPETSQDYTAAAEKAWFLLWNARVPAGGALSRQVMYMSKATMNAVWAWDNCFNALAVARGDQQLAWNQLLVFFDHQDEMGMVPDMITDLEPVYGFTKPPVHGWTIRKLVGMLGLKESLPYLDQLYKPLSRLTEWWYSQRDTDQDGMPQYHHGNDSGWDNATLFDQGFPTEGADLAAYLVLQCETLSFIAEALGKNKSAERWLNRSRLQLHNLVTKGVKNDRFFSPLSSHADAPETQSLLNYVPMVLGRRLPGKIISALAADLAPDGPYLTQWGLASESPRSPKYEPDGYWRGPIWAPPTHLIFDGLVDAGYLDLARTIAERFCDLCARQPGFWENYDALTGQGLRCPGYSWTAATFLLLAEWLYKN